MAIFPQGMTNIERRCNTGERKVFHALKCCLGDDYIDWHNVPIGQKGRQPDFVILSPRRGLLLLEVKDWKPSTLGRANTHQIELQTERGLIRVDHPIQQARAYALELVDQMKADPLLVVQEGTYKGKLIFPFGWGVALSNIERRHFPQDQFDAIFPSNRTLLRDDLGEDVQPDVFQERLAEMFTVHFPYTLSLPQRDRIRWHLFPEIRVAQQASLDLEAESSPSVVLPDLMQVMDLQQEHIARTLGEGHRVIHGVAGSGKTMILIFRAEQLAAAARADKPILVLCYNRALCGRIEAMLRSRGADERIVVRTFHAWCEDLVRTYQLEVPLSRDHENYYESLAQTVCNAADRGLVPTGQYTALLIDEAHDFEDAWLRVAAKMVDPTTNSLLVLYDDAQSIYQKKRRTFNFASVGIQAKGRTSILRVNYRNTAEILALSVYFAQSLLEERTAGDEEVQTVRPTSAGRRGPIPVLVEAKTHFEEARLIAECVERYIADGKALNEIAVLCRTRGQMKAIEQALLRRKIDHQSMDAEAFRRFDWTKQSVKLVTMHSAKGLEFPVVIIASLNVMPLKTEALEDEIRLLYVAMTRATRDLVLFCHGSSTIVERIRKALHEVQAKFRDAA